MKFVHEKWSGAQGYVSNVPLYIKDRKKNRWIQLRVKDPSFSARNTKWSFKPPPEKGDLHRKPLLKINAADKKPRECCSKTGSLYYQFFCSQIFWHSGQSTRKTTYFFQDIHFWIHLYIYWFLQLFSISRKVLKGRAFRSSCFLGPKLSQWWGGLYTQLGHFGGCIESVRNNPLEVERLFFLCFVFDLDPKRFSF